MELYRAADDDQWTLIRRYIDDCDYYIVIVAGRYGSLAPDGTGYTELEYRYASGSGKPVIAFLHKNPEGLPTSNSERSEEGQRKLAAFKELLQQKVCKFWTSPADLGSQVSRSLVKLTKSNPAVGWIRANQIPDATARELLKLKNNIEELQAELRASRFEAPEGSELLAQGNDVFKIHFSATCQTGFIESETIECATELTWNSLFAAVSPSLIGDCSEYRMRNALSTALQRLGEESLKRSAPRNGNFREASVKVDENDFQTVKVQLKSLGLITESTKARSVSDREIYWVLTPFGENEMTKLRAIKRNPPATPPTSVRTP